MAKNTTKDQEMAKRMKAEGVMRAHGRCPICYALVPLKNIYVHIAYHR